MLNGCGYTMFGIPSQDLERTWHDVTDLATPVREYPGSEDRPIAIITSVSLHFSLLTSTYFIIFLIKILGSRTFVQRLFD